MSASEIIHNLVQQLSENWEANRSGRYNEVQVRELAFLLLITHFIPTISSVNSPALVTYITVSSTGETPRK